MRLRLKIRIYDLEPQPAAAEEPLFSCSTPRRPPRAFALLGSVALHALAVTALVLISNYMYDDDVDWSHYRVEPLRLYLSTPLYFNANASASQPTSKAAVAPQRPAGALHPTVAPSRTAHSSPLQLPSVSHVVKDAPVILQPEPRVQPARPIQPLPSLAFWARRGMDLPKPPPPRETVTPGRTEAPSALPKLGAAAPVAAVPNREPTVADINVSMPRTPAPAAPALPLPNSATMPVRLRDAAQTETASLDASSGQPANVVAISPEHRDMKMVEIPRGLQNAPLAGSPGGAAASGDGSSSNSTTDSRESIGANQGAATSNSGDSASPAAAGAAGTGKANAQLSAAPGEHALGLGVPVTTSVISRPVSPPEVIRIEHPSNGNFDVVIMQSSARADLPEAERMLAGNPVYSVYLRVGDQKEWLLEYCAPAVESGPKNPYQVNIEDAAPVTPPYPISTVIPKNALGQPIPKRMVFHGFLTAAGQLRNVKGADPSNPVTAQILALLNEWQFRPALLRKRPIEIEILLVIPPRG